MLAIVFESAPRVAIIFIASFVLAIVVANASTLIADPATTSDTSTDIMSHFSYTANTPSFTVATF